MPYIALNRFVHGSLPTDRWIHRCLLLRTVSGRAHRTSAEIPEADVRMSGPEFFHYRHVGIDDRLAAAACDCVHEICGTHGSHVTYLWKV